VLPLGTMCLSVNRISRHCLSAGRSSRPGSDNAVEPNTTRGPRPTPTPRVHRRRLPKPIAVAPSRLLLNGRRHAVRRRGHIVEIQVWLGELELHEDRIGIRITNQIDACVQQLVSCPRGRVEHTLGRCELRSGRSMSAQRETSMGLETAIDTDVGARQYGGLPHGMAEYAVQINEGRFTLIIDGPQIRLHHHDATVVVQPTHVLGRQTAFSWILQLIATGVETGQAHRRLEHPGTVLGK
jgi:hypothetical protein